MILGFFLPKFWFKCSYWFKLLRPNETCSFLFLTGYSWLFSRYLIVIAGYFFFLPVTSGYFSLLLVPHFSNNGKKYVTKKSVGLLNQIKYKSTNSFGSIIQRFLVVFFFIEFIYTIYQKQRCVLSSCSVHCKNCFKFALVEVSYEAFVNCYENRNIGKYQAIIAHNILCVIFNIIS